MSATPPARRPRQTPRSVWAGALAGAVLGWALVVAEVTAAVAPRRDEQGRFGYRVRVVGVEVYRWPDDGEVFEMRPVPQMNAWRGRLALGSAFAGAAAGGVVGHLSRRPRPTAGG